MPPFVLETKRRPTMAKYLVIARGTGIPSTLSPQEVQKVIQKYMSWNANLRTAGRMLHSEKLRAGEGRVLRGQNGKMVVTDGPYVESKEVVGGFWLVEAKSYEEVVEMLSNHPHLDGPGILEVREIEALSLLGGTTWGRTRSHRARRASFPPQRGADGVAAGALARVGPARSRRGGGAGRPREGALHLALQWRARRAARVA